MVLYLLLENINTNKVKVNKMKLLSINKKQTSHRTQGIISGISCSIFYGLYPVLLTLLAFNNGSIKWSFGPNDTYKIVIWGFVLVGLKELFNTIFSIFTALVRGQIKNYFKNIYGLLKNKWGWLIVLGGIVSGPIGYTFLTLGILFSTPAYGSAFSSWMPIFTMIGAVLIFKDKINFYGWIGVILTFMSALIMGIVAITNSGVSSHSKTLLIAGIVLACFAPLCWSFENILIDIALRYSNINIKTDTIVNLKVLSGALAAPFIIVIATLFTSVGIPQAFKWYGEFFTNWSFLWGIALVGAVMFVGRFFFYNSVRLAGSGLASAFYNSCTLSTAILQSIFASFGLLSSVAGSGNYDLHWWFWIFLLIMIGGILLVSKNNVRNPKDHENIVWE